LILNVITLIIINIIICFIFNKRLKRKCTFLQIFITNVLCNIQYRMIRTLQFSELSLPRRILLSLPRSFRFLWKSGVSLGNSIPQEEKCLYKVHLRERFFRQRKGETGRARAIWFRYKSFFITTGSLSFWRERIYNNRRQHDSFG